MSQRIDSDLVKHIAFLTRLSLTEEETALFSEQLSTIIDYFDMLGKWTSTTSRRSRSRRSRGPNCAGTSCARRWPARISWRMSHSARATTCASRWCWKTVRHVHGTNAVARAGSPRRLSDYTTIDNFRGGTMDLHTLGVRQASDLLQTGDITSIALTSAILERIRAVEPTMHAHITVSEELAMQQSGSCGCPSPRRREGDATDRHPLRGQRLPFDQRHAHDVASKMLEDYVHATTSPSSTVWRTAGAVLVADTTWTIGHRIIVRNSAFFTPTTLGRDARAGQGPAAGRRRR